MAFKRLADLFKAELSLVEQAIEHILQTKISLLNNIFNHLITAQRKQIRPLCALLAGQLCGYHPSYHTQHAAIIEIIHTATLLHDDVIDHADVRRSQPSANQIWGNAATILTGDFLYAKAFDAIVALNNTQAMQCLAKTSAIIAEGEALQLSYQDNISISQATYFTIIKAKTASLFSATTEISAILATAQTTHQQALKHYGLHLGMAFQLMDDLLDYNDLQEGKLTLSVIYFLQQATSTQLKQFKTAFKQRHLSVYLPTLQAELIKCGAIDYTVELAKKHAHLAIQALEPFEKNKYWQAAVDLTHFVTQQTLATKLVAQKTLLSK